MVSGDIRSNSCSLPLCITPPPPIQHGAVLQEMEMLAVSVAGQMVARKGRHGFSTYPDKFPGVLVCTWGGPEKGPQGDSLMQKRFS